MKNINQSLPAFVLVVIFVLLLGVSSFGQNIGINGTGAAPDASALLDLTSNNKGLLIPRVSIANALTAAPVTAPVTSLLVYNTNAAITSGNGVGYYYWTGTKWQRLSGEDWSLTGNAGTTAGTNFLGTTDATDLVFKTNGVEEMRIESAGDVGMGTTNPAYNLEIEENATSTSAMLYLDQLGTGDATMTYNSGAQYIAMGIDNSDGDKFKIYDGTTLGTTATNSLLTINTSDQVGIGTNNPTARLHVNGDFRLVDGTQQNGYVLTSDATGLASWQPVAAGSTCWTESPAGVLYNSCFGGTTITNDWTYDGASEDCYLLSSNVDRTAIHLASGWIPTICFDSRNAGANAKMMAFVHQYDPFLTSNSWMRLTSMTDAGGSLHSSLMTWNHITGNVGIGYSGQSIGAANTGQKTLWIGVGSSAPSVSLSNSIALYAEDVAASAELKVRDEAGNVTTLSPHNFSLIPSGASDDLSWAYYSEHAPSEKVINVDMLRLTRVVEKLSGENLVYTSDLKNKNDDGTFSSIDEVSPIQNSLIDQLEKQEQVIKEQSILIKELTQRIENIEASSK